MSQRLNLLFYLKKPKKVVDADLHARMMNVFRATVGWPVEAGIVMNSRVNVNSGRFIVIID